MILANIAFRSLLSKGEKIHYVAHIHPFKIYPILFRVLFFGLLIPGFFYYLLPPFYLVWIAWGVFGIGLFLYRLMQWYLDAWLITNMGIIDQDWVSFFNKSTARTDYENIMGITSEIKGFWGTILNFGDLKIEHMSGSIIVLNGVAAPRRVENKVVGHHQSFNENQKFQDQKQLKDLITKMLRDSVKS